MIRLLAEARTGRLSADELAYVRGGKAAVEELAKRYTTQLAGLPAPE